jgi:catechol 2,3-dioxygenase-like lactoylglutathione lyase family enzyme
MRVMSTIKIDDIAHVRFRAPDLGRMQAFLSNFGLTTLTAGGDILYARAAGPAPFVHVTELGEPGFTALGLRARDMGDLERFAQIEGASLEAPDAPGGGALVRLTDPDGHCVEVVAGQTACDPLPVPVRAPLNAVGAHARKRATKRISSGPAHVIRLGHAVLNVSDFRASEAWYKERFGFITSDEIALSADFSIGAFLRCDRGDALTDHHTLFLLQASGPPGLNHAAFEVLDIDDLMAGHAALHAAKHQPHWGVGRHILGSQVFDYWRDPWGHTLEHWTDGDVFSAADGSNTATLQDLIGVQWGQPMPANMA